MKTKGLHEVTKGIKNSPFVLYDSYQELEAGLSRKSAIGYYNNALYYLGENNTVYKLIDTISLAQVINDISINEEVITNISTELINNNQFITQITESIEFIINLLANDQFIDGIVQKLLLKANVSVCSIGGRLLFTAFDPDILEEIDPPTTLVSPIETPVSNSCIEPTSIEVVGNLNPKKGSSESYTVNITGGQDNSVVWTCIGGVINSGANSNTVSITWNTDFNALASLNVSVGCVNGENPIFDFNFFVLEEAAISANPSAVLLTLYKGSSRVDTITNGVQTSVYAYTQYPQLNNAFYTDNTLTSFVSNGFYSDPKFVYEVVNGYIISIEKVGNVL